MTVPPSQVLLSALPAVRLVNLYGPTEAAVDVTAYEVGRGGHRHPDRCAGAEYVHAGAGLRGCVRCRRVPASCIWVVCRWLAVGG